MLFISHTIFIIQFKIFDICSTYQTKMMLMLKIILEWSVYFAILTPYKVVISRAVMHAQSVTTLAKSFKTSVVGIVTCDNCYYYYFVLQKMAFNFIFYKKIETTMALDLVLD